MMMTNKKKRLELRLDPETSELIDTLLVRTGLTKSSLIKNALKVYAGTLKNGHIFTIRYKAEKQSISKEIKKPKNEDTRTFEELIEDLDNY